MRIISADKLMSSLEDWKLQETPITTYPKPKEFTADDMQRMIWRTIRDCERAVEEQPTVKAVTVEWIEKYLKPYKEHFNKLSDKSKETSGAGWVIDVLESMLREWEKENDKDSE